MAAQYREYPANASPEDVQDIFDARRNVQVLRAEYLKSKLETKQAKAAWEESGEDLIALIDRIQNPQRELPFGPPGTSAIDHAIEQEDKARGEKSRPAGPVDDSWRKVNIKDLKLGDKIQDNLEDAGIFTIGQVADHGVKGKQLTDIGGIGPAKARKIDDALAEFWKRWKPAEPASEPKPPIAETVDENIHFDPPSDTFEKPQDWNPANDHDEDD